MALTSIPVTARLRSRLGLCRPLLAEVEEELVLSPASSSLRPAAIYHRDELARVHGVQHESNMNAELQRIRESECQHRATRAFRYRNIRLLDGTLYGQRSLEVIQHNARKRWVTNTPPLLLPRAQLCSSYVAERYFGHWMMDALALELLAEQRGLPPVSPLPLRPRAHEPGYRRYCGLAGRKTRHALVEQLWLVDDVGFTPYRVSRLEILRARMGAHGPRGQQVVFLARGRYGEKRHLRNEDMLVNALNQRNVLCVDPTRMDVSELRPILNRAIIVIGVEGSALMHAVMMMPTGGALLTIQPPTRFNNILKAYADAVGFHYGFTVADPAGDGFHLPLERLMRALDLLANTREQRMTRSSFDENSLDPRSPLARASTGT